MRVIFLSVFISLSLIKAQAQIDTVVVKDFSKEWMFFDSKKKLPLVKKSDFEGNTIHFNLDQTAVENAYLAITYPSPFSVFLNGKLVQTAEGKLILSIENYLLTTSQLPVIIYS